MSTEDQDEPLCPGCRQVVALLNDVHKAMDREPEPDAFEVIEGLPFLLEGALTHLLTGFDIETQRDSKLGKAVQLLTVAAARAEGLRVQMEDIRRRVES